MNLSLYIAKRYLFAKKSHNAINVISLISVCGITIATMAMVCALSVFNGFTGIVVKSFSAIDPELKIMADKGKVFDPADERILKVKALDEIAIVCESLEEYAMIKYEDRQATGLVKGVSPEFINMTDTHSIILDGNFMLKDGDVQFGVIGAGLAANLGARANFIAPIEIHAPKRDVKVNLANPSSAFTVRSVFPAGAFALYQAKYDENLLFISLELARELFRYDKEVSSLEIKLKDPNEVKAVKEKIKMILGDNFLVQDRFEQQEESFKMVNIEKWMTYLILLFILIIAVFNIIGSLSMLILDKREDINILRKMGANNNLIVSIFRLEGWLISFMGAIAGLVLGLILCFLQEKFGLLKLGQTAGTFVIDVYPVEVQFLDILYIFITVSVIGFLAVLYPTNSLKRYLTGNDV
ncbi:ABC transporter permease [Dysgonomonas sp. 216]|uniref:FtsX-like permease family protein n=1 Tax=Dysgonomonas sp. 216 TaxID=2302934 RepID=UPI0013D57121|nr:FtsX-like permease family protein [Dysgonomonas sp. 216]NDW18854.1 ABC transporter permease [Dysgonomonas sp. 216]